jgi:hypothetical protein
MSLIHLVVGFVCIFLAGMWCETWDRDRTRKSLYWCIFLAVTGLINVIAMLGAALS